MITSIKQWFAPPDFAGDDKKNYRVKLLNVTINLSVYFLVLVVVGNLLDSSTPPRNFVIDFIFIGMFLFLRRLLFADRVKLVGNFILISAGILLTIIISSEGTILAPATALFSLLVIMSGFIFNIWGIIAATMISSLVVAGLILAHQAGILPPPHYTESTFQWFLFTFTFGLTGWLSYFYNQLTDQALERSRMEIRERKRAEDALQKANEQLRVDMEKIEQLKEELHEQAIHDPLTGLYNRRYLNETLAREITRVERENKSLSVIMSDIDHFKMINDTYGHPVGDKFLVEIASLMKKNARDSDIVCRYGGEEFLLVFPGTALDSAARRAEEIRQQCAEIIIQHEGKDLKVTVSIGVATYPTHGKEAEEIIIKADKALYRAKAQGRNCTVMFE